MLTLIFGLFHSKLGQGGLGYFNSLPKNMKATMLFMSLNAKGIYRGYKRKKSFQIKNISLDSPAVYFINTIIGWDIH